jgi:cyclin G-associated kinase
MTEFFKSAFSNIFSNQNSTKSNTNINNDEFVGRNIVIGSYKLKIVKLIAEGGYAIVYLAQDITTGTEYAVKVSYLFMYIYCILYASKHII